MSDNVKHVPSQLVDQLSAAQLRVYERHAEVAEARAKLSHAEASFSEALADQNKIIHDLLLLPQAAPTLPPGVGESPSLA